MKNFYCQYCGASVSIDCNSCPNCKKVFESILCPKCLYSGSSIEFRNGCPSCGYLKVEKEMVENSKTFKKSKFNLKIFILLFSLLTLTIALLIYLLIK